MTLFSEDNPAWAILTDDERTALSLQILHDKSTWQAGEIMGKAHYKYLEIRARARKFLKMFTEHFELYNDELIIDKIEVQDEVRKYFEYTISKRLTISSALKIINYEGFKKAEIRQEILKSYLDKWENSDTSYEINLFNLIKDFDRWNNFRILPIQLREPSAFKRRNKNTYNKHIKNALNLKKDQYFITYRRFKLMKVKKGDKNAYCCLFEPNAEDYNIFDLPATDGVAKRLASLGIYLFIKESDLEEYISIILDFSDRKNRHCKLGQVFWPRYREVIKKAFNYTHIQKIPLSRRIQEQALRDMDKRMIYISIHGKKRKTKKYGGQIF